MDELENMQSTLVRTVEGLIANGSNSDDDEPCSGGVPLISPLDVLGLLVLPHSVVDSVMSPRMSSRGGHS